MSTQTKARPPHEGATRKGFAAAAPPPSKQRPRAYRFTREQYERMIEAGVLTPEDRCELLEGHIVDKMPQSSRHTNAIRRISRALQPLYPPESATCSTCNSRSPRRMQIRSRNPIFR